MATARFEAEIEQSAPVPRLLVELPSWPGTFFANLRDMVLPRRLPHLELRSAPAPFWPDVFVNRGISWFSMAKSGIYHAVALALLIGLSHLLSLRPRVIAQPAFDRAQVVYYQPSEYLPPLDTRGDKSAEVRKADPEYSRQSIISVPAEADNRSQTIVTPPNIKLKHDIALPNIVAWSDRAENPRLDIPPVPLTPAAEISRIRPQIDSSVVAPPPDAQLTDRRRAPALQSTVVAPPADLNPARSAPTLGAPQPALIAPPPSMETSPARTLGDLNIGRTAVINAAPQLPVAEQRTLPGGRASAVAGVSPQVIGPPASVGASGGSTGAPGRVIALSLRPAVGAPPNPPAGNRRGEFAAGPEGHSGATGTPGTPSGKAAAGANGGGKGAGNGNGSTRKGTADLPSGLYVGSAPASATTSAVAGPPGPAKPPARQINPNLVASVSPPRVSAPANVMQPGNAAKLSEAEREVFGDRRFYSLTLNMPNLNSAGGSWVIRFAELRQDPRSPAADLSQPMATRKVDPAYPLQLMRENVAGTVILYAVIHADGTVGNVRVLRGVDDRLDRFASEAVAQWKFDPAKKNGAPVDVEATFQIPFRPSRTGSSF